MKQEVLEHITRDNDRWDLLAWEYYGDAFLFEPIVAANPEVMITTVLPPGIRLVIPVIVDEETIDTADLPPWMQL